MDLDMSAWESGGLSNKDILEAKGLARVDLFRKLQLLWDFCETDLHPGKIKPDMRKAALALGVAKELGKLFQLDKEAEPEKPDTGGPTPRERDTTRVLQGLLELEARSGE